MMERARLVWTVVIAGLLLLAPAVLAQDTVVLSTPGAGSAIGLLSEVIKKSALDQRQGLALDIKDFSPAAAEQAVLLRRADAGIFAVVAATIAFTLVMMALEYGVLNPLETRITRWRRVVAL